MSEEQCSHAPCSGSELPGLWSPWDPRTRDGSALPAEAWPRCTPPRRSRSSPPRRRTGRFPTPPLRAFSPLLGPLPTLPSPFNARVRVIICLINHRLGCTASSPTASFFSRRHAFMHACTLMHRCVHAEQAGIRARTRARAHERTSAGARAAGPRPSLGHRRRGHEGGPASQLFSAPWPVGSFFALHLFS